MTANTAGAGFTALTGLASSTAVAGADAVLSNAKEGIFSVGIGTDVLADGLADGEAFTLTYDGTKSVTITGHADDSNTMLEIVELINGDADFGPGVVGGYTASVDATHGIILTANEKGTSTGGLTVSTTGTGSNTKPAGATVQAADNGAGTPMGADLSNFAKSTVADNVGTAGVLAKIDNAIKGIASARADFGATINRLEYTVDNLSKTILNTQAAKSQIVDADYAAETTELARTQIIAQASTAMLSQANQAAQSVLALLK
jgi:flagellin